jgi:hypothetical protein
LGPVKYPFEVIGNEGGGGVMAHTMHMYAEVLVLGISCILKHVFENIWLLNAKPGTSSLKRYVSGPLTDH